VLRIGQALVLGDPARAFCAEIDFYDDALAVPKAEGGIGDLGARGSTDAAASLTLCLAPLKRTVKLKSVGEVREDKSCSLMMGAWTLRP
jgi:hypothetical protein